MQTGWHAAVGDVATDPICASIFVDGEAGDEEDDLDDEVSVYAAVADVCEWFRYIRCAVLSTEDFEAV